MKVSNHKKNMIKCLIAWFLVVGLTVTSCGSTSPQDFSAWTKELFVQELSANTLNLHYTLKEPERFGITEYEPTIGDFSKKSRKQSISALKEVKRKLSGMKKRKLSGEDELTYETLMNYTQHALTLSEFELYEDPLLPNGGTATQLPLLLAEYAFDDAEDISDYLTMLSQLDGYFDQVLAFEQEKADAGLFMSDALCQKTITELEHFLTDPEEYYLHRTFLRKLEAMPDEAAKADTIGEHLRILSEEVMPAYRKLIAGLTGMMGYGRNESGLCYYEKGKEYYQALVQANLGCEDSMDALFTQISDTRTKDLAACANLKAANEDLAEKCQSYSLSYTKDEEILARLREAIRTDFPPLPKVSCAVEYVDPSMAEYLAPAFYITAPCDAYTDNTIYINSAASYPDLSYFVTLAHEAVPGHLYQTVMSYEYGITPLRTLLNYPGYTEGWATYVEFLSYEYADLEKPVAQMLKHSQLASLSLYAASDIGIHYYGWNRKELLSFWSEFGVTDPAIVEEIEELVLSNPGNYLSYYVGCVKLMELRDGLMEKYGDDFSLKTFHEALLRIGPTGFSVLKERIGEYYEVSCKETG